MEHLTPVITDKFRILAIIISVLTILYIINKIKNKNLHIRLSLLWLIVGFTMLFLSIFPDLFFRLSQYLGFILPINALTFFSILFLIITVFNLYLKISQLQEQNKILTQELGLIKNKINNS